MQKRALAIHDISCVGRCSLTVALPVLSAVGVETSVLPTAVLSTQTGGMAGYTFRDLSDDIPKIVAHWKRLGLCYDAIYTGYLGSFRQLALVSSVFDELAKKNSFIMVDPVMGDGGTLYAGFSPDFPKGMRDLCRKADMVVPNLTEASLLLGIAYREHCDKPYVEDILRALTALGPKIAVLSGVSFDKDRIGAAAYDRRSDRFLYCFSERVDGFFHGTGDVFSSSLLAALLAGRSLNESLRIAVDFTHGSILRTKQDGTDVRYGVNFEGGIGDLIAACKGSV